MPKRKQKKYSKPKRPYDKERIQDEDGLVKKYGLKNKKEIWKSEDAIEKIRGQAKSLLTKSEKEQEKFMGKLRKSGFDVNKIADILSLNKEDYLKRRLQSIVVKKGLATTPRQARQFIVHKHISINKEIINAPSYIVPIEDEKKIELLIVKKIKEEKKQKGLIKESVNAEEA